MFTTGPLTTGPLASCDPALNVLDYPYFMVRV